MVSRSQQAYLLCIRATIVSLVSVVGASLSFPRRNHSLKAKNDASAKIKKRAATSVILKKFTESGAKYYNIIVKNKKRKLNFLQS